MWVGDRGHLDVFVAFTSAYMVRHGLATTGAFALPPILWCEHRGAACVAASRSTLGAAAAQELRGRGPACTSQRTRWLLLTLVLGCSFSAGRYSPGGSLRRQGLSSPPIRSSSFFYVLTGPTRCTCWAASLALGLCPRCAPAPRYRRGPARALDAASLYWHFMDVLWLYLLLVLALRSRQLEVR